MKRKKKAKENEMGINAYGGISEAKYSEGGVYVLPGRYRFKVLGCKHITTRKKQEAFVVELEVMESTNVERPVGSLCSWMVTLDKEPALGNIKAFICVAVPCAEEQVNEQAVHLIIGEGQPLKNRIVRAVATNITTKAGRDFTKVKWLSDDVGDAGAAKTEQAGA
jgi:hypothetical protein